MHNLLFATAQRHVTTLLGPIIAVWSIATLFG